MNFDSRRKTHAPFVFALALLFLSFATEIFGVPITEYREKIASAQNELYALLSHDSETETIAEMRLEEREIFAKIRKDLPVKIEVETDWEKIEADNGWILEKLKQMETETPNSEKQISIINETIAGLGAIEVKLRELETLISGNRTKDEDKQKLSEILSRFEYQKPVEEKENILQKTWREFTEWLESLFPKRNPTTDEQLGTPTISFVLQLLIYGIVFAIIGFLIYRFAPFLRNIFYAFERTEKKERVILGEKLAADETSENIFAEAEKLAREGNLRAAIRKAYIAFLCELGDRKIIGLSKHKTNRDYLRDVRKLPKLHQNMSSLTIGFERVWYGFSQPDNEDWENFREKYKEAVKKN